MTLVFFKGRVLPEARRVSVPETNPILFQDPNGFEGNFLIKIHDSFFAVECNIIKECENIFQFCAIRSLEFVGALVDIYAFSKGWALSVIVDSITVDGRTRGIALSELSVQSQCIPLENSADFQKISDLVLPNLNLRFAFRDLISSLSTLNYSAIAAARAIEAIRRSMSSSSSESEAWQIMRNKLRIERSYLQFITDASRYPRHGDRGATDGVTQMMVTHRAWETMNRYLEFMKQGGEEALPKDKYPLLTT